MLAARALGPEAYGRIAVLWAALFLTAVVLCRPLEQTTSRALADRLARGEEIATVVRAMAVLCAGTLAAVGLAAALARDAIGSRLFQGDGGMAAALFAGIAIYAVAYVLRGILAGTGWFRGYGLALVADTAARLALALPLVVVASQALAATAVVAAGAAGILLPAAGARRRLRAAGGAPAGRFRPGAALAFAAPVSIVAAADQLFVNGGPLLVALGGGADASAAAGLVFAATMLVRVPVFLFQGVAASLLPSLTRLQALADTASFRGMLATVGAWMLGAGGLLLVGAAAVGPEALRLVYGPGYEAGRAELVLLAAGVGSYLAGAALSQALLALDRASMAAASWAAAAALFLALYAALPGEALWRISVAFACAAVAGLALLLAALALHRRRTYRSEK